MALRLILSYVGYCFPCFAPMVQNNSLVCNRKLLLSGGGFILTSQNNQPEWFYCETSFAINFILQSYSVLDGSVVYIQETRKVKSFIELKTPSTNLEKEQPWRNCLGCSMASPSSSTSSSPTTSSLQQTKPIKFLWKLFWLTYFTQRLKYWFMSQKVGQQYITLTTNNKILVPIKVYCVPTEEIQL